MVFENLNGDVSLVKTLMQEYKESVKEERLKEEQYQALEKAIEDKNIYFFVAKEENCIVGMCSVSRTFSTYTCNYGGIFEDFYIIPEYRKTGLARNLINYVFGWCEKNGIRSLWVGSADCDVEMYRNLGFDIQLGNLLTWAAD